MRTTTAIPLAMLLAICAGFAMGQAVASGDTIWWQTGGLLLGAAALVCLAALYVSIAARRAAFAHRLRRASRGSTAHSRLGELLVRKHRLITQRQLDQALSRQLGTRLLLGRVLMSMGLVTLTQLDEVLRDQHLGGGIWRSHRRAR